MDIDKEKLKTFIVEMMASFKELETEIMAAKAVILSFTIAYGGNLEALMETARKAPMIQKMMADKYDAPREEFLARLDKAEMNETILEYLRLWKPQGPPV
jgi:hypothetical protein